MNNVTKALDALVDLLDLEAVEIDLYRGVSPADLSSSFHIAQEGLVRPLRSPVVGGDE